MQIKQDLKPEQLSPWWKHTVVLIIAFGFTLLIWRSVRTYSDAPPIPQRAVTAAGATVFTHDDIVGGQNVFLKYGLMDNGTIWGHGAYLGPDFSADYLHRLTEDLTRSGLSAADVQRVLKENRYDAKSGTLTMTEVEARSFEGQIHRWQSYFNNASENIGLPQKFIDDPGELRQLTAFFAWTAWASSAVRPGKTFSYTNNFPYDPATGNNATGHAVLWSALSLVALLDGIGVVLFAFGKFSFLGWKSDNKEHVHPQMLPRVVTDSQRATVGFWNFLGAGVFGFLINLPIVSYFEVGTTLTPNHGHAAMMGVFGMLAVALVVFALRQVSSDHEWAGSEKYVRVSFWGLNVGLLLMLILNLFPGGVFQLLDVVTNGYWHARSPEFMSQPFMKLIEWLRMPADLVFIAFGVLPLLIAGLRIYRANFRAVRREPVAIPASELSTAVRGSGD